MKLKSGAVLSCPNCKSLHNGWVRYSTIPADWNGVVAVYENCPDCVPPNAFEVPIRFQQPPQRISQIAFLWLAGGIFLTIGCLLTLAILKALN